MHLHVESIKKARVGPSRVINMRENPHHSAEKLVNKGAQQGRYEDSSKFVQFSRKEVCKE